MSLCSVYHVLEGTHHAGLVLAHFVSILHDVSTSDEEQL